MHRPDRFDDGRELTGELPDLPIPRPGEGAVDHARQQAPAAGAPAPLSPPRLGGGASYTAVDPHAPGNQVAAPAELAPVDRDRLTSERFTWEIASRLTAGMLANPARNSASVKDAMAMFDQFLQEVSAYSRIASEADPLTDDGERRRRDHVEYFKGQHAQPAHVEPPPAGPVPTPEPTQPRPMSGYQPLPPGARPMYIPGSMAGAPLPPTLGEPDADVA